MPPRRTGDPVPEFEPFPFPAAVEGVVTIDEMPEALLALVLSSWAPQAGGRGLLHVARSETRAARLSRAARSFAPDLEVLLLPPWDCSPYDRGSPSRAIMGRRVATLQLLATQPRPPARLVVATVESLLQRVPPRSVWHHACFDLAPARAVDDLRAWLIGSGYVLDERVDDPGEAAFRGEVIEIFPSVGGGPVRIEHADGRIVRMRHYDPVDQRTTSNVEGLVLHPASEIVLDQELVRSFLAGDEAAQGVLLGEPERPRRASGLEHRLPVFYDRLETLFDYLPDAIFSFEPAVEERLADRLAEVADAYGIRVALRRNGGSGPEMVPLEPRHLYLDQAEWRESVAHRSVVALTAENGSNGSADIARFDEASDPGRELARFVRARVEAGDRIVLAARDPGTRRRLAHLVERRTGMTVGKLERWGDIAAVPGGTIVTADLDVRSGFAVNGLTLIAAEQVGLSPAQVQAVRATDTLLGTGDELRPGDLVVHAAHGIARLRGLELQEGGDGTPASEYFSLEFAGDRKLLVPALELEQIWRYGSEAAEVALDRLGGDGWRARRAEVEAELDAAAGELLARARHREQASGPKLQPPMTAYRRFAARFPFTETDDQARAIEAVLSDLGRGSPPMNRLVCGDVGFGKTEVALRAACAAALAGKQVAVVAPTTVLVRQHLETFRRRFAGFDVRIEQLSRLSGGAEARAVRAGLADGSVRIVIGTHALASEKVRFADLGLLVIDEEQRFGARQKEQLRRLRAGANVLTLTATPIPRTLQAALVGLIDISVIAIPPVRRRPVRTFVAPFDPATVREALRREAARGGQSFFVCPRIQDLQPMAERLSRLVPELDVTIAHGRMRGALLDEIMVRFAAGTHDVLLTTDIIEAGLDIPNANTMLVWRADRFGLAQLHQLRGRVGRGARRASAYLLTDPEAALAPGTEQRLRTLETMEALGAGFAIGARDLDLRGAGDLLGADQAGHVGLIGTGLYQRLLARALKRARGETSSDEQPVELRLGIPALIPDEYVPEPEVRLSLYRRLAGLADEASATELAEEIADRFGTMPEAVRQLIELSRLRQRCRAVGIARLEAGPKGVAVEFHKPRAEHRHSSASASDPCLHWRGDRLICKTDATTAEQRLRAAHALLSRLTQSAA